MLSLAIIDVTDLVGKYSMNVIMSIRQDHQALLKAKYCPRVAAASRTQKNTKNTT